MSDSASSPSATAVLNDGLWGNNAALVQLLGLCPLLAVSNTVKNAVALGLATMVVLLISNVLVSLLRGLWQPQTRIVFFVLIIATAVSAVDQLMAAWYFELHQTLGLFVPLIVTNCAILGRAEAFASRNGVFLSAVDALAIGLGFALALTALGALREGVGSVFLLASLGPGAFFGLALLLALHRAVSDRLSRRAAPAAAEAHQT